VLGPLTRKKPWQMRIVFDLNPVLVHRFSGFHTYGVGLLEGFESLDERPEFVLFHSKRFSEKARRIKERLGSWAELGSTPVKMRWLENFWRYASYPALQYFTGQFEVYHCCHHLMPPTKGKPRVLTVYDLRRYIIPEFYQESRLGLFEFAVRRADHFVAISEATKNDLCRIFDICEEKVDVVHLAADKIFEPLTDFEKQRTKKQLADKLGLELENYLLVFSSPDRRKNIPRTIEAFLSVRDVLGDNYKLVVIGNVPRYDEAFKSIAWDKAKDGIILTGALEQIQDLFRCANGLVFASLYEGFGIPILEAFRCGVPVITSNCSSMPEVGGDAAAYVDPYSVESIAESMLRLCSDSETRRKLIDGGFRRGQEFSWKRTASETLDVYKKFV